MKAIILGLLFFVGVESFGQSQEAQQLILDYKKLQQLEKILDNMKKGYDILYAGYTTIENISKGNFSLHDAFLSALYAVSPVVKNYKTIPYIISYQKMLLKQGRNAFARFKNDPHLSVSEVKYMDRMYRSLFAQSQHNIDELLMVITASKLRMNDEQRLAAIDRIYRDVAEKFSFVKAFNEGTQILIVQRAKEENETDRVRRLYSTNL